MWVRRTHKTLIRHNESKGRGKQQLTYLTRLCKWMVEHQQREIVRGQTLLSAKWDRSCGDLLSPASESDLSQDEIFVEYIFFNGVNFF